MPGLLRGVARTAAIAGTATAVSNRVSRRQQGRWAAKEAQQAPEPQPEPEPEYAPAPADSSSMLDQLAKLGELRDSGVLTEAEFEAQKAKILNS
jgi:hypothetical protein